MLTILAPLFETLWVKLAALGAVVAAVFLAYFKVREDGVNAEKTAEQNAEVAQVKTNEKIEQAVAVASTADIDKQLQQFTRAQ